MPKSRNAWTQRGTRLTAVFSHQQTAVLRRAAERRQTTVSDVLRKAVNQYFDLVAEDAGAASDPRD